jgi:hypothetical protein
MLNLMITFLLWVHGSIHLMGFVKSIKPAALPAMTRAVGRAAGVGWLMCALLFPLTGVVHRLSNVWWMPALATHSGAGDRPGLC